MKRIGFDIVFILIISDSIRSFNERFVTLRRLKSDYSVSLSKYLYLNWTSEFEPKYTITELKYNGFPPEPEKYSLPDEFTYTWIETELEKLSLGTILDDIDCEAIPRHNLYVAYGAIDLMNFIYTSKDKTNTVSYFVSINS